MLEHRAILDQTPVFLDSQMRPIPHLSGWFRSLSLRKRDAATMRPYAYIVLRLAAFLEERGTDILSATEADLVAYRFSRTQLQDKPVDEDTTWSREASVIDRLYTWLRDQNLITRKPVRLDSTGRNPLTSGTIREMDVRHMTLPQYLYFRDVGFGGMLPDGTVDFTYRGINTVHRGRASEETALLTGMRKQEWSTLLIPELGEGWDNPAISSDFRLQACAKYKIARDAYVPAAAHQMIHHYRQFERNAVAATAARNLARKAKDLFIVTSNNTERGTLTGTFEGRTRTFTISAIDPDMRRLLVREGEFGLEALAVFIGQGGFMLSDASWDRIRWAAWDRAVKYADADGVPPLPRKPWRYHDARHTYALQLLKQLYRMKWEREGQMPPGPKASPDDHVLFGPILRVQRRLGHKRLTSTLGYLRYMDDPMNYVDDAFREWTDHDGATYAEIALRTWHLDVEAARA
ncbi:site-specific integrase [Streptomyces sp. NBC_01381]|uniref:site-specific integrase n=1 Tax=Streptomyces sp. NBC_01381 TaxID=2903845 RepID=UPI0022531FE0|nr:site-specific integrase [Streptomyces sp. NBC_01381]MCX4669632.1 site-specific integrase [Streptomyces sp. NBC_01381]